MGAQECPHTYVLQFRISLVNNDLLSHSFIHCSNGSPSARLACESIFCFFFLQCVRYKGHPLLAQRGRGSQLLEQEFRGCLLLGGKVGRLLSETSHSYILQGRLEGSLRP